MIKVAYGKCDHGVSHTKDISVPVGCIIKKIAMSKDDTTALQEYTSVFLDASATGLLTPEANLIYYWAKAAADKNYLDIDNLNLKSNNGLVSVYCNFANANPLHIFVFYEI